MERLAYTDIGILLAIFLLKDTCQAILRRDHVSLCPLTTCPLSLLETQHVVEQSRDLRWTRPQRRWPDHRPAGDGFRGRGRVRPGRRHRHSSFCRYRCHRHRLGWRGGSGDGWPFNCYSVRRRGVVKIRRTVRIQRKSHPVRELKESTSMPSY